MSFRTQLDRSDLELTPSHYRETQGVILGEYLTSSWTLCFSSLLADFRLHTLTQSQPKAVLSKGTMQTGHIAALQNRWCFCSQIVFLVGVSQEYSPTLTVYHLYIYI